MIKREHDHSNRVALDGFSEEEAEQIYEYLLRVRKNIEKDWEDVKKAKEKLLIK